MREILKKYFTEKELSQMSDIGSDPYPEFILSRDGQVYFLQYLYKVNGLPGKIDDNGVIVPLKNA